MLKTYLVVIVAGLLLIVSCSKDVVDANDGTFDCTCIYSTDDSSRSTSKTLKGHILFSWKNDMNNWNYSIVPNLNVSPASENISENNSFTGEECLKKNLSYFAEDEEIFWVQDMNIETIEGKKIQLSYPPDNTIQEIQEFCDLLKIKLVLD